jgi:microcystin-dependent protein
MAAPSGRTPINNLPYPIQDDDVNVPRDVQALAMALDPTAGGLIIGEVRSFALPAPPPRWKLCDGAILDQAAYPELYAAIGGLWNISGETASQFRLPSIAGRTIIGVGQGKANDGVTNLTNRTIANRVGTEKYQLQATEAAQKALSTGNDTPDHIHSLQALPLTNWTATHYAYASAAGPAEIGIENATTSGASNPHHHDIPGSAAANPHENMQPSIALLMCIYAGRL